MIDYVAARFNMVEGQIKPNKVTDSAVLNAMLNVPREMFVPKAMRGIAYVDEDIRISGNRYLIEPMVLARMLNEAHIEPHEVVLDIGCGTGYSTAVIARLANTVVAVESDPELARQASALLAQLGVDNAAVVGGSLAMGHPAEGPYQCILINGSVAQVPQAVFDQLADGGRLVTVISASGHMGRASLFHRADKVVSRRDLFDAATPFLPGFEAQPSFVF